MCIPGRSPVILPIKIPKNNAKINSSIILNHLIPNSDDIGLIIVKEINNRISFPIYQGKNFRKFISVDISKQIIHSLYIL